MTPLRLGMRVPPQDIPIVNNHPINFERRIWPKSHPRAGAFLAKVHGNAAEIVSIRLVNGSMSFRYSEYHRLDSLSIDRGDGRSIFRYDLA